jgi:phage repressor protein C with HTH and peptisase S24 domain
MAKRVKSELNVRIGQAIKTARKRRGMVGRDIAEAVGVETGAVGNWESGQNAISTEHFFKVAELLKIDAQALARGELKYLEGTEGGLSDVEPVTGMEPLPHGPYDVELLGVAVGGADGEFLFNGEVAGYLRRPPGLAREPRVFALTILGDSMSPRYEPGELIFCDAKTPEIGDYVVIEMFPEAEGRTGKAFVKRLKKRTKNAIVVEQFNPPKEMTFDPYAIKHLWRVVPSRELHGY